MGTLIKVPKYRDSSFQLKTLKEESLGREGAKLFNSLPRQLKDFSGSQDSFKNNLCKFLKEILDKPNGYKYLIHSSMNYHAKPSTSIRDWVKPLILYSYIMVLEEMGSKDGY